ncbi:hypothetical protein [Luteimonas saliphila]|uniref:hypothetical protein n=1 Tax=Luteimonas saliphila TaxID=2804919 RepID=UPI00192D664F|nr:hypothetical protein [Luteimonas saliphila]
MAKRPPQRPQRKPDDGPAVPFGTAAFAHDVDAQAAPAVDPPEAHRAASLALPTSREEFIESLGEMRAQGSLDVADEAAILREYDVLLGELKSDKARLEAEFRERTSRDGQDASRAWLAEAAEALGRRQGERMRHLFQTIPALTQPSSTA